jgi:hypothetical protein
MRVRKVRDEVTDWAGVDTAGAYLNRLVEVIEPEPKRVVAPDPLGGPTGHARGPLPPHRSQATANPSAVNLAHAPRFAGLGRPNKRSASM